MLNVNRAEERISSNAERQCTLKKVKVCAVAEPRAEL